MLNIAGCTTPNLEPSPQEELREVVFHADWAPETKTVLQEDGSVWWSPGDEINLFPQFYSSEYGYYTHPLKFVSTNKEASSSTEFVYNGDDFREAEEYVAVFPYNSENIAFKSSHIKMLLYRQYRRRHAVHLTTKHLSASLYLKMRIFSLEIYVVV